MFCALNEKMKKLTVADIALVKLSVLFFTIVIVKLLPQLLDIGYPSLILLTIACALIPFYKIWIKK